MSVSRYQYQRIVGYVLGFIFFFAPFALFQRGILYLLGQNYDPTIHNLCFRIPIEHILNGRFFTMGIVAVIGTIALLVIAFLIGTRFCGKFCPAGAVPEYLSKMIPSKFKINWNHYVPIVPLRYGFLVGFLIAPLFGGYLACSYCNYYVFDLLFNFVFWGYAVAFSSSLLLTLILWLFVFGMFTQGGRGFCNFFCPVGALQNFVYYFGSTFSFAWRLEVDQDKCVQCGVCVKKCPMTCMNLEKEIVKANIHHCILCMECASNCPHQAITYCQGKKEKKSRGKNDQWIIGLGAASSGIIQIFLPAVQKSCTGSCGACGSICIPGILVGSWLIVSCLYKRLTDWMHGKSHREAVHES